MQRVNILESCTSTSADKARGAAGGTKPPVEHGPIKLPSADGGVLVHSVNQLPILFPPPQEESFVTSSSGGVSQSSELDGEQGG